MLDLRPSTVSHHLARLADARLVHSEADGHYHVYALDTGALEGIAQQLLATDELSQRATSDVDA